ncbi:MAG TPA: SAM-dependent DNA methyltransferase [Arcobacter sp.]|nr:SAM-dependent DNA methyltransferase [Arcobacter sp.]
MRPINGLVENGLSKRIVVSKVTYNERSWAIDIISEISIFASRINKPIKRAGGESTINTGSKRYFPDVLLYGERSDILMGWELKMPDTSLSDSEFIDNATEKAKILGLNGFLLWNAQSAVLYISVEDEYIPKKSWDTSGGIIKTRADVLGNKDIWIDSLHTILNDLNTFFESGSIQRKPLIESFKDSEIINFILKSSDLTAVALQEASITDRAFNLESALWWRISKHEYPGHTQWEILAEIVLVNWINKILFANILTAFQDDAKAIYNVDYTTNPSQATEIFKTISSTCDFWNIFQPQLGEQYITTIAWNEILQLNLFLKDVELASIGQDLLQNLLENIIYSSKRKVAGQYTTPMLLARFLVHLTLDNQRETLHDPCCGTGTIPRAAYDIKREAGINAADALSSIYASDKVAFPLQMATLAISEPANMGEILQIFKEDCTDINVGETQQFRNPYDGSIIEQEYQQVSHIASNLPFIQQEDLKILNPGIKDKTNQIIRENSGTNIKLKAKSDLYAYLPFYFWKLLNNNGRLGIIISNSWLGTEWGSTFKEALSRFFKIDYVITAGRGRWFHNADVVTNILILQKKVIPEEPQEEDITKFVTITQNFDDIVGNEEIQVLVENIMTDTPDNNIVIQEYKTNGIMTIPLNWNTLFSNISWLTELEDKLVYCNDLLEINRGERRGWNPMFYPEDGHGIESDYIRSVLRTPRHIQTLVAEAETEAFCCSLSIPELEELGHTGALAWIRRFEHEHNTKGEPLIESLCREGYHWYEMNDSTMADLVASMNFSQRIFIAKFDIRSFVDQRITRFTAREADLDIELTHALLNSILGIFFIESLGFGRGLGVLDLSSTRMKKFLRMLNPELLTQDQATSIKEKFSIVRNRNVKPILEELITPDRIEFEDVVLDAFDITHLKEQILNSFLYLYNMRTSVNQ